MHMWFFEVTASLLVYQQTLLSYFNSEGEGLARAELVQNKKYQVCDHNNRGGGRRMLHTGLLLCVASPSGSAHHAGAEGNAN